MTGIDLTKSPYEARPIRQINPNLPKGLDYIIAKCIQLAPSMRYQSCDELIRNLNNYKNLLNPKGFLNRIFRKK